ncbi:putative ISNCY family transposase ISAtsp9 [Hollandina sp. SP2]
MLDGGVLLALDGLWHYSSKEIHCEHGLHMTNQKGETTYYHSAVAGAIVKPGSGAVIPVMVEGIRNGDGEGKQDWEHEAGKRWLMAHGQEYRWLKATLLGDDLYSNQPFCEKVLEAGMSFLFTCKPDSHPWLTETVENSYLEEKEVKKWRGRVHQTCTYRWINGVPLRDSPDALLVNYLYFQIRNGKTGEVVYKNSWVTDKEINGENGEHLAGCGRTRGPRARWKIEKEHNNVLKNRGYNLEHNVGHGKNHAAELCFLLNLLAFQFHRLLELGDEGYGKVRASVGRRDMFFTVCRRPCAMPYMKHGGSFCFLSGVRTSPTMR